MGKTKRNKINGGFENWLYQNEEHPCPIKENAEHIGNCLQLVLQNVQIVAK